MSTAPQPIFKGIYQQKKDGLAFAGYFLKHNADAGESPADDCFLTLPLKMEGGEHKCGESGIFPMTEVAKHLLFVGYPQNNTGQFFQS
jgi:hypothetical protein